MPLKCNCPDKRLRRRARHYGDLADVCRALLYLRNVKGRDVSGSLLWGQLQGLVDKINKEEDADGETG